MEEQLNPLAVTHLLQHTLRSLCLHDNSQWVYAVFWRILPRNYPPPKWDGQGAYERSRGNRRNWILVWEDGFCNFAASTAVEPGECGHEGSSSSSSAVYMEAVGSGDQFQHFQGLQPDLFFKMSHEIYNYGEGVVGKVAADYSHKWVYNEPNEQEINFLSAWHNTADSHPRTWAAQFRSGIKTIALIAVREGVVQLGSLHKVIEDLSYVVLLRKRFSYIESIPGVLLPHPSSSASPPPYPYSYNDTWHHQAPLDHHQFYDPNTGLQAGNYHQHNGGAVAMKITPSMNSLEALLSKLPSVVPPQGTSNYYNHPNSSDHRFVAPTPLEFMGSGHQEKVAKEEEEEEEYKNNSHDHHHQYHHHHHLHMNVPTSTTSDDRF